MFLFDEPLSNLDASLRVQTRLEIARLHERLKSTMIYVTHDQVEAMTLADKIVVLRAGVIEQVGTPMELYETPANAFVAQFIGSPKMNFFQPQDLTSAADRAVTTGIRPEHLTLSNSTDGRIKGRLELVEQLGEYALVHLVTETGREFTVKLPTPPLDQIGHPLWFNVLPAKTHYFDPASGRRMAD